MITSQKQYEAVLREVQQVSEEIDRLADQVQGDNPACEIRARLTRLQYHQMELEAALVAYRQHYGIDQTNGREGG